MKRPEYLHITKASKLREIPEIHQSIANEIKKIYTIPVRYFVTAYVPIEATSLEDAMTKAQDIEAPDLYVEGVDEPDIEAEVFYGDAEELPEWAKLSPNVQSKIIRK